MNSVLNICENQLGMPSTRRAATSIKPIPGGNSFPAPLWCPSQAALLSFPSQKVTLDKHIAEVQKYVKERAVTERQHAVCFACKRFADAVRGGATVSDSVSALTDALKVVSGLECKYQADDLNVAKEVCRMILDKLAEGESRDEALISAALGLVRTSSQLSLHKQLLDMAEELFTAQAQVKNLKGEGVEKATGGKREQTAKSLVSQSGKLQSMAGVLGMFDGIKSLKAFSDSVLELCKTTLAAEGERWIAEAAADMTSKVEAMALSATCVRGKSWFSAATCDMKNYDGLLDFAGQNLVKQNPSALKESIDAAAKAASLCHTFFDSILTAHRGLRSGKILFWTTFNCISRCKPHACFTAVCECASSPSGHWNQTLLSKVVRRVMSISRSSEARGRGSGHIARRDIHSVCILDVKWGEKL